MKIYENVRGNWKKVLLFILDERWFTINYKVHPRPLDDASVVTMDDGCQFLQLFNSYSSIDEAKGFPHVVDETSLRFHVYASTTLAMQELYRLNLIHIKERGGLTLIQVNEDGLDVALKLQEHDDNKERFKQQSAISNVLKDNSSKSVATARWALALSVVLLGFGGYRVYQLEQKILSHSNMKQRIHSAEEESSRLNEEVVRLKDELSRLISVDNDKGKPVAVNVDSNKPATEL
jgi:hypothetical protein